MVRSAMRSLIFACLLAGPAGAAPRVFIAAAHADGVAADRPVEARRGEGVHLYPVVVEGGRTYSAAPALVVGGQRVKRVLPLEALGSPVEVRWFLVEPRQHHVDTPAPNFANPAYSNNVLFGPRHGKWLGHDTLEYDQTALPESDTRLTLTEARPLDPRVQGNGGLGTVRFAVEVRAGAWSGRSPGAEANGRGGISPKVMRVSFRRGDDLPGWLTSYFNVPNVFGSAGYGARNQAELHQGADCADVLVAALRKAGSRMEYTSVSGLFPRSEIVTDKLWMDPTGFYALTEAGTRGDRVHLGHGREVRPGDLMVIDYGILAPTGRTWDHIGMLDGDEGEPGVLDPEDPLMHMGYLSGLERAPIRAHRMAIVQFLRVAPRHLGRAR